MAEAGDEAPKHPYVTEANAKVHLVFSIILIVLSVIQLILGIIMSEVMVNYFANMDTDSSSDYYYRYNQRETNYMMGDGVWIAMIGFFNGLLGLSVWKTRSRANGVILTVFLFLSFFLAYTTACGLSFWKPSGGALAAGVVNGLCTLVTGFVTLAYAFYTSFHACCNSKVRKERRVLVPPGMTVQQPGAVQQQPQFVYVQQPGQPQYIQQPGQPQIQYVQQPGQYIQQPGQYVQQPGQYVQQPQVYNPNQQQVFLPAQGNVYSDQPPQYAGQPVQQPPQQQQQRPDLPPVYTEKPPAPE